MLMRVHSNDKWSLLIMTVIILGGHAQTDCSGQVGMWEMGGEYRFIVEQWKHQKSAFIKTFQEHPVP
jgi:hypothetical protein